jgi:hypothetical protein
MRIKGAEGQSVDRKIAIRCQPFEPPDPAFSYVTNKRPGRAVTSAAEMKGSPPASHIIHHPNMSSQFSAVVGS